MFLLDGGLGENSSVPCFLGRGFAVVLGSKKCFVCVSISSSFAEPISCSRVALGVAKLLLCSQLCRGNIVGEDTGWILGRLTSSVSRLLIGESGLPVELSQMMLS
jgi:hypothetical protein